MTERSAPGDVRFSTALLVASALKVIAVLSFVGGVFATGASASSARNALGGSDAVVAIVATGLAGTVITAALFGFAAFVVEILVGIFDEMLELRLSLIDDHHVDDTTRSGDACPLGDRDLSGSCTPDTRRLGVTVALIARASTLTARGRAAA